MTPDIIAMMGVGVAAVAIILTALHRMEARINRRIDEVIDNTKSEFAASETRWREDITAVEARTTAEIKASEARLREEITAVEIRSTAEIKASEARTTAEIKASEARTTAEIKASEARTGVRFEEVREQFTEVNAHLRTTNDRMSSIERQQARLGGLLEGLREALFQRVQQ